MPRYWKPREIWTEVAGVTYANDRGPIRSRQEIIRKCCRDGGDLVLIPEPKNQFSRNAIGVWVKRERGFWHGESLLQVGYVPEEHVDEIKDWRSRGCRVTAHIWKVVGGSDSILGLRINIVLHPLEPAEPVETVKPAAEVARPPASAVEVAKEVRARKVFKLPPVPTRVVVSGRAAAQIAFYQGLGCVVLGLIVGRVAGRPSDISALGVVLAAVGAGVWGSLVTVQTSKDSESEHGGELSP